LRLRLLDRLVLSRPLLHEDQLGLLHLSRQLSRSVLLDHLTDQLGLMRLLHPSHLSVL
jgi:hypothetical protein